MFRFVLCGLAIFQTSHSPCLPWQSSYSRLQSLLTSQLQTYHGYLATSQGKQSRATSVEAWHPLRNFRIRYLDHNPRNPSPPYGHHLHSLTTYPLSNSRLSAMSAGSPKALAEQGTSPLNFIYSCSLCCASFADVYEGHNESVRGLSDGINPKERLVTKLYLATCCHVFCSSHLEGGGPPFHPAGKRPKASCPVCTKEKADCQLRELYSVRGFNKDEHDPQIPPSWFTAPPIRLDGNGKEMEALRFQYIALIRYCQNTHAARKPMQNALTEAQHKLVRMQDLASEEHAKVLGLQQENQQLLCKQTGFDALNGQVQRLQAEIERYRSLDVNPRDLETFRANKTAIRHYLKLFPMLLEQNEKMKERLASLGFAMALQPVPNFPRLKLDAFENDGPFPESNIRDVAALTRKTASSHTAGRSAHTSGRIATASSSSSNKRPLKRQRQGTPRSGEMDMIPPTSRDAMPPPPKPLSRMQSMRKMIPIVRKKFSHQNSASSIEDVTQSTDDITMIEHKNWHNDSNGRQAIGDESYMSGALPIAKHHEAARPHDFQVLSSMGMQENRSNFTFRAASPVKIPERINDHQAVQLPTEPSYIRLMDGLSQNEEVELELRDPRQEDSRVNDDAQETSQHLRTRSRWQSSEVQTKKRFWRFGQPFLHQSPHESPPRPHTQMDQMDQYPVHTRKTSGGREYYQIPDDPTTPDPRRYQRSAHQVGIEVSPFFKRIHRQAPLDTIPGLVEPQANSNISGAFHSQRPKMAMARTDWREPPSLNRLSFIDSPVNARNEVIQQPYTRHMAGSYPSSRLAQDRSEDSRAFITRPDVTRSTFMGDSAHGSFHDQSNYSQYEPISTQSATLSPSFKTTSCFRTQQPCPVRQQMASSRSPVRTRPQWEPLQRAGVRSSRQSFGKAIGCTNASSSANFVPNSGRRSVRR
ncbi:hypothetical protein J1614_001678 [Plenodomus biglobosus]|nr:hypothetical protein J1614_001678 [Plenodomus biglobosus]